LRHWFDIATAARTGGPMWSHLGRIGFARPLALVVALLPAPIVASSAQTGSVTATVLDATGNPLGAAQVIVVGLAIGAMTNTSGVAVLSNVPAGLRTVESRRIGFCASRQVVTVPDGGNVSVTLGCADIVIPSNTPTSPLIAVLGAATDATGSIVCRTDIVLQGTGRLQVGGNATLTDAGGNPCRGTALLLARDRAPLYANAGLPWTGGLGDVYPPTMATAKLRVAIRIYIGDAALTSAEKATLTDRIRTIHLAHAGLVLDDSYAGIELVDSETAGGDPQILDASAAEDVLVGGCANAQAIRASAFYSADRINVYYLQTIGGSYAGYSCDTSDAPDIILIDHDQSAPYTLTHEIGHSLGLMRPDWGHSQLYEGFYYLPSSGGDQKLNVMAETSDLPSGARYFSVGQVAWMHLSDGSWLNRPYGSGGSTVRTRQPVTGFPTISTSCGCPETGGTLDCARLNVDIDRAPAMKQGAITGYNPTCIVKATVTSVSVCKGNSVTVGASLLTAASTPTSTGSRMWVSLDPSIATVSDVSVIPSDTMSGVIAGVNVGTTRVRAYVSGSFAPIDVTVKPSC
jgi:hypothetical protein